MFLGLRSFGGDHLGLRLPPQGRIQRIHGAANGLGIARGIGLLKCLGGLQHGAVAGTQRGVCVFALGCFAVERVVNRFAKRVPQFLLKPALQRYRVCFSLPTLLQRLDCIDVQYRRATEHFGLFNHGVALLYAQFLQGFKRRGGGTNGCQPKRLQLVRGFFAQVARIAPAVAELVKDAVKTLPVIIQRRRVGCSPALDFLNQRQPLRPVLGGLQLDFFKPGLDHLVRLVASLVKALPKPVVGNTALVGLLPLFTQCPQVVLHLASTQFVPRLTLEQAFGLGHQLFTQLVCAPALPALQLTGCGQGRMGLVFEFVTDDASKLLQRVAQRIGCPGAGFAMSLRDFKLELGQHFLNGGFRLRLDLRINLWLLGFWRCLNGDAPPGAQFIGP